MHICKEMSFGHLVHDTSNSTTKLPYTMTLYYHQVIYIGKT